MTYCAYLVETPSTAPTTSATGRPLRAKSAAQLPQQTRNDASHFYKVSWPEDDRLRRKSEGEIIKEARARVEALPKELRKTVTEHIPDVREQGVIPNTSTAIIRTIFGLDAAGSRSQYWMVSKKLLSLSSILDDFNVFKRVYWEFIRCHPWELFTVTSVSTTLCMLKMTKAFSMILDDHTQCAVLSRPRRDVRPVVRLAGSGKMENIVSVSIVKVGRNDDDGIGVPPRY